MLHSSTATRSRTLLLMVSWLLLLVELPVFCLILVSALQMLASMLVRAAAWMGRTPSLHARVLPHTRVMMARLSSGGSPLETTVLSALREKCNVDDQASLLLCVSGGSDSVAMLHILAKLREERLPDLKLSVLHFNHKLRPESDDELAFVRDLAKTYEMPFFSREWEHGMQPTSQSHFEDLQNRAREWRKLESMAILDSEQFKGAAAQSKQRTMSELCECATSVGLTRAIGSTGDAEFVVTAHQLDDQVETILMKVNGRVPHERRCISFVELRRSFDGQILRGVHLSRIKGMDYVSGHQARPLLDVRKADLISYLQNRKLSWMEDSSNATPKYKRNRVRNELVPLVTELAGGQDALLKRLTELAGQSKQLADWMNQYPVKVNQTTKPPFYFELNEQFQALPEMVRVSALHDWVTR
jgi:tRNA(Ile)-lysidine synthase